MANNSFILKGWSVTLVTGIIALSLKSSIQYLIYSAFLPAFAFWGLDAYYLRRERLFRNLYNFVRVANLKDIEPFSLSMNLTKRKDDDLFYTFFSMPLIALHLTLIVVLTIIAIIKGG